jgi:hypothetical protein
MKCDMESAFLRSISKTRIINNERDSKQIVEVRLLMTNSLVMYNGSIKDEKWFILSATGEVIGNSHISSKRKVYVQLNIGIVNSINSNKYNGK